MKNVIAFISLLYVSSTAFASKCDFVSVAENALAAEKFESACLPLDGAKSCVVHVVSRAFEYDPARALVAVPYMVIDNNGAKQMYGNVLVKSEKCELQYIQKSSGSTQAIRQLQAK